MREGKVEDVVLGERGRINRPLAIKDNGRYVHWCRKSPAAAKIMFLVVTTWIDKDLPSISGKRRCKYSRQPKARRLHLMLDLSRTIFSRDNAVLYHPFRCKFPNFPLFYVPTCLYGEMEMVHTKLECNPYAFTFNFGPTLTILARMSNADPRNIAIPLNIIA